MDSLHQMSHTHIQWPLVKYTNLSNNQSFSSSPGCQLFLVLNQRNDILRINLGVKNLEEHMISRTNKSKLIIKQDQIRIEILDPHQKSVKTKFRFRVGSVSTFSSIQLVDDIIGLIKPFFTIELRESNPALNNSLNDSQFSDDGKFPPIGSSMLNAGLTSGKSAIAGDYLYQNSNVHYYYSQPPAISRQKSTPVYLSQNHMSKNIDNIKHDIVNGSSHSMNVRRQELGMVTSQYRSSSPKIARLCSTLDKENQNPLAEIKLNSSQSEEQSASQQSLFSHSSNCINESLKSLTQSQFQDFSDLAPPLQNSFASRNISTLKDVATQTSYFNVTDEYLQHFFAMAINDVGMREMAAKFENYIKELYDQNHKSSST